MSNFSSMNEINQKNTSYNQEIYTPFFYNLKNKKEEESYNQLIRQTPGIVICNEIDSQLEELIKLRFPKEILNDDELEIRINNHLQNIPKNKYGVWVYYPWLNKIVHLLEKNEFIEVRTNRNQYKITPEEEKFLAKKKIGIIGLSVGKSIATTIAMERICGEIVLADFDLIELSNLNRIQTGVFNFNVKKTIVAAREIAEFDPFLKVTCYHDGLTESNMDDFFTKDGKLDICIEVCDGLSIKVITRQKAKELGIPVIMDTNDRGMIDIERYDLDPNLPILHGLIDHLDLSKISIKMTNDEKLPFISSIIGFESMSLRLKKSFNEVGKSIVSWPQLASSVNLGGAITCDISRKILLDELKKSGRYYVDTDKIFK